MGKISLDKLRESITSAFHSQYGEGAVDAPTQATGGWIAEVFDDYVIGEFDSVYYKIYFSRDSEDVITFSERTLWIEVEKNPEWVAVTKTLKTRSLRALKTISKTQDELRVGNYMALFGGRDLEGVIHGKNPDGTSGEYFTPDTDFESSYTKTGQLDINWEHGLGQRLDGEDSPGPNEVLGYVDWKTMVVDKMGLWVERVLDRRNAYMKYIEILIDNGLISNSSEAFLPGVKTTRNGEITKWPLLKDTLTVEPMEPRMMSANVIGAMKSLSALDVSPVSREAAEEIELRIKAAAIVAELEAEKAEAEAEEIEKEVQRQVESIRLRARALTVLAELDDEEKMLSSFDREPTDQELVFEKAANRMIRVFGFEARKGITKTPVRLRIADFPLGKGADGLAFTGDRNELLILVKSNLSEQRTWQVLKHETGHQIDADDRKSWKSMDSQAREARAESWETKLDEHAIKMIKAYWRRLALQPRKIEISDKAKALAGADLSIRGYL